MKHIAKILPSTSESRLSGYVYESARVAGAVFVIVAAHYRQGYCRNGSRLTNAWRTEKQYKLYRLDVDPKAFAAGSYCGKSSAAADLRATVAEFGGIIITAARARKNYAELATKILGTE